MSIDSRVLDGMRVLIVDGELDNLDLLRDVLEASGAKVTGTGSAEEALAAFDERGPFDVIVSDIGMPHTDGYALIRTLRERGVTAGDVPAIALTAYAGPFARPLAKSFAFRSPPA